jgi:hypothetical protein
LTDVTKGLVRVVLDLAQDSEGDEAAREGSLVWQSEKRQQEGRLSIATSGVVVWLAEGFGRI